jgi:hypothetical protein
MSKKKKKPHKHFSNKKICYISKNGGMSYDSFMAQSDNMYWEKIKREILIRKKEI